MKHCGTQQLETGRLVLRRLVESDAGAVYRNWASDPEVTRFLTWPTHSNVEVTRMLLNNWISRYDDGGYFNWAIEWKESGSVIGNIAVVKLNDQTVAAEMGYCMSRAFWGRGIMP